MQFVKFFDNNSVSSKKEPEFFNYIVEKAPKNSYILSEFEDYSTIVLKMDLKINLWLAMHAKSIHEVKDIRVSFHEIAEGEPSDGEYDDKAWVTYTKPDGIVMFD